MRLKFYFSNFCAIYCIVMGFAGVRRKNERKDETKRGKKAKDIGKNKQPKCQNIVRLVRFIEGMEDSGWRIGDKVVGAWGLGIFGGLLSGNGA